MAISLPSGIVLPDSYDNVSWAAYRANLQTINDNLIETENTLNEHLADFAAHLYENVLTAMSSIQDSSGKTTNITIRIGSNIHKIFDFTNFDSNDKPQTERLRVYDTDGTTLLVDKTRTYVWKDDGSSVSSFTEVSNL